MTIDERTRSIYGSSPDVSFAYGQYCRGERDQEKIMKEDGYHALIETT